jgi:glutathione S-transferase
VAHDGDISLFETGAILLYAVAPSDALMPADLRRRGEALQCLFAALGASSPAQLSSRSDPTRWRWTTLLQQADRS